MKAPAWLRRLLPPLLIAAAFGFLGAEIARNLEQLRTFRWELRPGLVAASLLLQSVVLLGGVIVWKLVLRRVGIHARFLPLARAWFLASLSRYIPGVVWQFVSLAQLGGAAGLTAVTSVTSSLVQMGFNLLAAALLGVYLLPAELAGVLEPTIRVLRWVAPLGLVAVHPGVIGWMLRHSGRLTRQTALEWTAGWAEGLWLLLLSLLSWAGLGGALFLFLRAFVELPLEALPAVIAMNAMAFIAGYLAFFAPGGLGFKEAALGLLLSGLMPPAVAASLAVAARLWSIAGEAGPALLLLPRRRGRATP